MKRLLRHFAKTEKRVPFFRKSKAIQPARPEVETVNHDPVREADPYSFTSAHKRLAWMLRLSAITNASLVLVCIVQGSAIAELVPLKTTELALVTLDPVSDHLKRVNPAEQVRITPITNKVKGYDLMFEAFVRQYTRLVGEIDTSSQTDRMRKAAMFTDGKFWKKFGEKHFARIEKALTSGLNRSITVETTELTSEINGIRRYAVELVQTDMNNGVLIKYPDKPNPIDLRAYVTVTARPQTVHAIERYENPAGFRVLDIKMKPRGNK